MKVVVAGGTGRAGAPTAALLRRRGHDVVALSRSAGQDLTTGEGLDAALEGADAVVDASDAGVTSVRLATRFVEASARHLLPAEARAGVGHHVVLSIVGCDAAALPYHAAKHRQEVLAREGDVPVTVVRTTQWHTFPGQLLDGVPLPVVPFPRARVAPVDVSAVAELLVEVVEAGPGRERVELRGPEVHDLPDLMRRVERARGGRRPVVGVRLPGPGGRRLREGVLLPDGGARTDGRGFDAWLAEVGAGV